MLLVLSTGTINFHVWSSEVDGNVLLSLSLSLTACSFSSRGLPSPKMAILAVESARSFTSLLTERGFRFNLGLERRSSVEKKRGWPLTLLPQFRCN